MNNNKKSYTFKDKCYLDNCSIWFFALDSKIAETVTVTDQANLNRVVDFWRSPFNMQQHYDDESL